MPLVLRQASPGMFSSGVRDVKATANPAVQALLQPLLTAHWPKQVTWLSRGSVWEPHKVKTAKGMIMRKGEELRPLSNHCTTSGSSKPGAGPSGRDSRCWSGKNKDAP